MSAAFIGHLTVLAIFAVVVFFVIGVFAALNWIWRKTWHSSAKPTARRSF